MSSVKRRPVEDFASIFRALSRPAGDPVVLVGGHAVNVWALAYQARIGRALRAHFPLTSADVDVYATRNGLLRLHHELGGQLQLSGPREITEGTLVIGVEPDTREIDVLRSVRGIPRVTAQDTVALEVCGYAVPVLFPHLLLQGKLANAVHLDQAGRQDVKHVAVLALVLPAFLSEVVGAATPVNEQPVLSLLQKTLRVVTSDDARAFTRAHGPLLQTVFGDAPAASALPRLAAFARRQLPRGLAVLAAAAREPGAGTKAG
ncbi:MAG: hypothetical protein WC485_02455 [Opitutaceae bacterium]